MARERRVLLVEDDPHTADVYLLQLRRDGIPVEHVRSGDDADRFVRERHPVLVLIDLRLPDSTAQRLIEGWAGDAVLAEIPVWIFSAALTDNTSWWHHASNVQRCFLKARVVPGRLSQEIRATLGLSYGKHSINRLAR